MKLNDFLTLTQINDIPVLVLAHPVGNAKIALQGAQLLSWQPQGAAQDVLWLSEIEPFKLGSAIRGGVPICWPWFGPVKQPSHGTARLRLWQLSDYAFSDSEVRLEFALFSTQGIIEAKVSMIFNQKLQIRLTHLGQVPAQAALHSYFRVADIHQVLVENLPTHCLDKLTDSEQQVPSSRAIREEVDCVYELQQEDSYVVDKGNQRTLKITHQDASEIVLWNPWHKATSAMSAEAYQEMVCVETARLSKTLAFGESVAVEISLQH